MFHIYYLRMNLSNLFLINQLGISSEYEQYKQHSSSRFQQRPRLILILVLIVVLNSHFSHPSHLSSSVPLWSSPLSPSITPTLFHLRLKPTFSTQTARHPTIWLFHPLLEVLNCWWLDFPQVFTWASRPSPETIRFPMMNCRGILWHSMHGMKDVRATSVICI